MHSGRHSWDAELFFEDSAILLKNRLLDEFKVTNVKITELSKNNYTFTNYVKLDKPFVWIKELWHPTIGYNKSIKNNNRKGWYRR